MSLTILLLRIALQAVLLSVLYVIARAGYRLSPAHPLAHIPGPLLPRISSLWLIYHAWIGDECSAVHRIHQKYGTVVRTGPNSVDITDGEALNDIYTKAGGFNKAKFYSNFDIDGHPSIFSEVKPENRAPRAKAVLPLFSTASLRAGKERLEKIVDKFVSRCQSEAQWSKTSDNAVNILDLTRGLALDAVTGYLFGRSFGGLEPSHTPDGQLKSMSANGMVDLFVGVGRFWYLPSKAFKWVEWLDGKCGTGSNKEVGKSLDRVGAFTAQIVADAEKAAQADDKTVDGVGVTSYPARMLQAGLSPSEVDAQCKDLIFAGTDSTGMNLATILFFLCKQADILVDLEEELEASKDVSDLIEIQSLPLLRGVVREGLRLSMANPSRLTRVVPASGWVFKEFRFPADTEVSCTPFELHLNPSVFADPHSFNPQRWIDVGDDVKTMDRDSIYFGLGTRQCIARNLATAELFLAVRQIVLAGVLRSARPVKDRIEVMEWFNSHVKGGVIELKW